MLLQGHIDALTACGFVEGWAFDAEDPGRPLSVCVLAEGTEVAAGLANLYRWDLADAGYGTGWCAFRLRLAVEARSLADTALTLLHPPSATAIAPAAPAAIRPEDDPAITHLEAVIRDDPTCVRAIEQLRGCARLFDVFIDLAGIDAFVNAAYLYILGRPADETGLAHYAASLRDGSMIPYDVLRILHACDEFDAATRLLIAPPEPGFAFHRP